LRKEDLERLGLGDARQELLEALGDTSQRLMEADGKSSGGGSSAVGGSSNASSSGRLKLKLGAKGIPQ
jgi:hypothetical protein